MPDLSEPAWAKVNLYLHVTGRRHDGYHLLDSLTAFPAVGDVLHYSDADSLHLDLDGPFGAVLVAEADNLVLRAARALALAAGVMARGHMVLEKHLPIASGIGGGSADAAAALRLLCGAWDIAVPEETMARIAVGLGADVPVCLASVPQRMQGVGERVTRVPVLPECGMVLINPGVAVATQTVFRARQGGFTPDADLTAGWPDAAALAGFLATTRNDLEPPAMALAPAIGVVLTAMRAEPACLLARMSGSGATCFGLFPTPDAAEIAAARLSRPGWWAWGGSIRSPDRHQVIARGLPERVHTP